MYRPHMPAVYQAASRLAPTVPSESLDDVRPHGNGSSGGRRGTSLGTFPAERPPGPYPPLFEATLEPDRSRANDRPDEAN